MAVHLRGQIRAEVVGQLADLASTETRVFPSRRYPLQASDLPALCVYVLEETSELMNMGPQRHLRRRAEVIVEGVAQVNATLDEALDRIALEVETAIGANPSLNGLAYDTVLTATRISLRAAANAEMEVGSIMLTFAVTYRSKLADPSTTN